MNQRHALGNTTVVNNITPTCVFDPYVTFDNLLGNYIYISEWWPEAHSVIISLLSKVMAAIVMLAVLVVNKHFLWDEVAPEVLGLPYMNSCMLSVSTLSC